ncbi:hypothetical protein [Nocardioides sp. URHA0020]|uniref:hypothetical protein n=1 Tax=Nocardioides sp. URHA0020 TaxID=1380392 RepID=UPI00048B8252|nr:hypothetical protein [Nocardioides sp. URHA0020]
MELMTVGVQHARRTRISLATLVLITLSGASALAIGMAARDRNGTAFADSGPQAAGVLGLRDVKIGDEVLFALPAFDNNTDKSLTVQSVHVNRVPAGFKILGYRTLSYAETDGMMLSWDSRTSGNPAAITMSERWTGELTVPPHSAGKRYALVHARITKAPLGSLTGVEIDYTQSDKTYRQHMSGEWQVEMMGTPRGSGG